MRNILIITALIVAPFIGFSQYYAMDYGILAGASQYLGEFGGNEKEAQPWILDMKRQQTRFAVGGEIESLDDGTLYSAFKNRTGIKTSSD